ncbi:MAG: 50S ribosomal protein L9 [Flavobacteriales bacterium]|nr:50S ribosomal protein L9 [Flavobacteriales bacterium]
MEVILKKDLDRLGSANEIVTVKDGYGRNYLIPRGLAVLATESAKKVHAENQKQQAHKAAKIKEDAEAIAEKMSSVKLQVGAKAGEKGKIFGSVNTIQISEALEKEGYDIDRRNITIVDEPIKELGSYKATVKLHKEVAVEVDFEVVAE